MFQHDPSAPVVRRRFGFLSVSVLSLSAVLMTTIVCASGLALFSLSVIDSKADTVTGLIGETLRQLPELRASLPPVLADAMDDVRSPEYLSNVDIAVRTGTSQDRHGFNKAIVEVANKGDRVISLLSMRIVGIDDAGDPVTECNTWAATPIQTEDRDWRGPLLPNETRKFIVRYYGDSRSVAFEHEVTELRVWQPNKDAAGDAASSEMPAVASRGVGI